MTSGEDIVGGKHPSGKYPAGRVCAKDGCTTPLSRYNPGRYCTVHERSPREKLLPHPRPEGDT